MVRLLSLAIGAAAIGSAAASVAGTDITKRDEERVACYGYCRYSYTTGDGTCRSGFKRTHLEAKGYQQGSYCERDCTAAEKKGCADERCTGDRLLCDQHPGSRLCKDAILHCGYPIRMTKAGCTKANLDIPVTYDDSKGMCSYDHTYKPTYDAVYTISHYDPNGGGLIDKRELEVRCSKVTEAGYLSLLKAVEAVKGVDSCRESIVPFLGGKPSLNAMQSFCNAPSSVWEQIKSTVKAACPKTETNGPEKPTYFDITLNSY